MPQTPPACHHTDDSGDRSAATVGPCGWQLWWPAAAVISAVTALRLVMAARVGLGDVEAYYWVWSRHLAPSYFDHGPVVAVILRAGTALLGDSPLGVRLPFVLLSGLTMVLLARRGAREAAHGSRAEAALWAVLLTLAMPAFLVAGAAANPDVPFVLLVVLVLEALDAAVRRRSANWLLVAGTFIGLASSAKYFGLALLWPLWDAARQLPRRRWLVAPAAAMAGLGLAPVVLWNLRHGWPSLHYHLVARHTRAAGLSLETAGKLVGGQLGYVSPMVLVGLLAVLAGLLRSCPRAGAHRSALVLSLSLLLPGYGLILLVPAAEPHWPMAGYLPLVPLLAAALPGAWRASRRARVLTLIGAAFSALVAVLFHVHVLTDLGVRLMPARGYEPRYDLSNELVGWPQVAAAVDVELRRLRAPSAAAVACHYTSCAQLTFAARGRFRVLCPSPRRDQFDYLPGGDGARTARGRPVIYVRDERFPFDATLLYRCGRTENLQTIRIHRGGRAVRRFDLQLCSPFNGLKATRWPPRPAS